MHPINPPDPAKSKNVNLGIAVNVVRPADMLVLSLHFSGLRLIKDAKTKDGILLASEAAPVDAQITVKFPAQSVGEQTFAETDPDAQPPTPAPTLNAAAARLAGASVCVFKLTAQRQSRILKSGIVFNLVNVLKVLQQCELVPQETELAAPTEGANLKTLFKKTTLIEAPYRILLSPESGAVVRHSHVEAATSARVPLWHTRVVQISRGISNAEINASARVPFGFPQSKELTDGSLTTEQRQAIVKLTTAQKLNKLRRPIRLNRLMLSALGAHLDTTGNWDLTAIKALGEEINDETIKNLNVRAWLHRMTLGRDQYVKVVEDGVLYPFLHRVSVITVSERKFQHEKGAKGAFLRIAPKSLPRLRFGRKYQLRVRTVDLAGQSLFSPLDEAADNKFQSENAVVSNEIVYQRFAPILPPAMIYKSRQPAPNDPRIPIEGESLERMVIRSDIAKETAGENDPQKIGSSERFFAAPKAAQTTIELHGELDGLPPKDAYERSVREYATLIYTHQPVFNPTVPHVEVEESPGKKRLYRLFEGARKIERHEVKEDGKKVLQETYWVQDKAEFKIAYLPDPLAKGVIFRGMPNIPTAEKDKGLGVHKFSGAFPDFAALKFRLTAAASGAKSESKFAEDNVPSVILAPGETVEISYASFGDTQDLARLALSEWIAQGGINKQTLATMLANGEHAGLTPYRKLTLVHAVKQPLKIPSFDGGAIKPAKKRELGSTAVALEAGVAVHRASTEKVDVSAEFADWVDAGTGKGVFNLGTKKHTGLNLQVRRMFVGTIKNYDKSNSAQTLPLALTHEIGDTVAHEATYSLEATTAFR